MQHLSKTSAFILGISLFAGLTALGFLLGNAALDYREYERSVTVKGLSERDYPADVVIWPISFAEASNDLPSLYEALERGTGQIRSFLEQNGVAATEITVAVPVITDKSAQQYGGGERAEFRYAASQTVTVYSANIEAVRSVMSSLSELGRTGIVFTDGNYQYQTEYIFNRLNEVKPEMVEEATREARMVAEKFAEDSQSTLGKIKNASQGQFTISNRDTNNPHIKTVRVVSTVEYYLSD
ncbi:MAG: SIMPL domain-containing protein [Gammaproteobacteria bacterium]|nr:SIMPL domain-containing protein [Gammaproteobacteria bacterium]MDP2141529.1 SIMPL domain-containing protein [Gammaproteobacteria bacterium]MDP2347446.1 SIMPL domain-containing protein [Gammaproteobacteria bacterium]